MRSIQDFNVQGKRVLLRCSFNVPLDEKTNILDDFRIKRAIPTIEYLSKNRAKIVLISHLGRPQGKLVKKLSLAPVQKRLMEYLDFRVDKVSDCIGKKIEKRIEKMQAGEILLLENLRFYKQELDNDPQFAKELAKLGDIYINDAFSVSHRKHASLVGIPEFLPSGIGLLFEKEIKAMSKILKDPQKPLVGIIGGAKVHTKIEPINEFIENPKIDFLLIGGKIANTILRVKGISIGKRLPNKQTIQEIKSIKLTNSKLKLPLDVSAVMDGVYIRNAGPGAERKDESILDIGPETIKLFSQIISRAKTIFWSGPLGKVEDQRFINGTLKICKAIAESEAYSVIGGRETVAFIRANNLQDKFSHLSTGGGAMLEYLSKGTLIALEALK
ncbi:MAG: phosphoglycerate kinase [Candidatus Pacebacteria bacterium]|nr:phosphoglycerate kinase [Candidatus Paceibacterota bacterium]